MNNNIINIQNVGQRIVVHTRGVHCQKQYDHVNSINSEWYNMNDHFEVDIYTNICFVE